MNAGNMETLVSIRRPVETNNSGVVTTTYPSSMARGTEYAEMRGLRPQERFQSVQLDASVDYEFRFYSTPTTRAIVPKDRLLVGSSSDGNWFDVAGALDPNERGRQNEVRVFAAERHV